MKRIIIIFNFLFAVLIFGFAQSNQLDVVMIPDVEEEAAIYGVADISTVAVNAQIDRSYGVRGFTNSIDGIGVLGTGRSGVFGQGTDFGVFGSGSVRAGSFLGDLEYTGMLIGPGSDRKLKTS